MKKIIYTFFIFVFLVVLFAGCKKENMCDCIKRTGSIINETRDISGFDRILVEDNLNVFITEDANFLVKVEAGKNIVPLIKTELNGNTLIIKNNNRCNWTRSYDKPLNVYVSLPVIKYMELDGTGKITGLNPITTDSFDVHVSNSGDVELIVNNNKMVSRMHGSGDIILHGTTSEHSCDIGGTGYLRGEDLATNYTYVHTYTLGQCYVKCFSKIDCRIDYKGDVYCYGNPLTVSKNIKGSGQLYLQ